MPHLNPHIGAPVSAGHSPSPTRRFGPRLAGFAVISASLLFAVSCASKKAGEAGPMPTTIGSPYKNEAGFGGEAITTSQSTNATIVSIDASTKMMKLKMPDGALRTYGVDVDVVRRGKAKAGDAVKVVTAEEHTLFVGADSPAEDDGPVPNSIHMPAGSSPLVRSTATKTYAAKVTAIDAWNDSVTLRLSDGRTKTTQLTPNFNLADVRVGDEISIRISEATLILLDQ